MRTKEELQSLRERIRVLEVGPQKRTQDVRDLRTVLLYSIDFATSLVGFEEGVQLLEDRVGEVEELVRNRG